MSFSGGSYPTSVSGGDAIPTNYFNVLDYGAIADGSTDNTSSFTDTIAAIIDNGGGTMYFPKGLYFGQIIIPKVAKEDWTTIEIRGDRIPKPVFGTANAFTLDDNSSIVQHAVIGEPVINVVDGEAGDGFFNFVTLRVVDFEVRTYDNPDSSGINALRAVQLVVENVFVNTGIYGVNAAEPTHASFGIITPFQDNGALTILNNVIVTGYAVGISCYEHTSGENINIAECTKGLRFETAFHGSHFGRVCIQRCTYPIAIEGNPVYFNIDNLNIERAGDDTVTVDNDWQQTNSDIDDPNAYGKGNVKYKISESGGSGGDREIIINNGQFIFCERLGTSVFNSNYDGTGTILTPGGTDGSGIITSTNLLFGGASTFSVTLNNQNQSTFEHSAGGITSVDNNYPWYVQSTSQQGTGKTIGRITWINRESSDADTRLAEFQVVTGNNAQEGGMYLHLHNDTTTFSPVMIFTTGGIFSSVPVSVPFDAYDASGWNSNGTVPTKQAIRDKIESLVLGGGGLTGFTTFGAAPNTDGGSVSGANIILQPADATHPGGISITTQTIAGVKTFNNHMVIGAGGANNFALNIYENTANVFLNIQNSTTGIGSGNGLAMGIIGSTNGYVGLQDNLPLWLYTNSVARVKLEANGDVNMLGNVNVIQYFTIGNTNKFQLRGDYGGGGEFSAGSLLGSFNATDLNFFADVTNGTTGNKVVMGYFAGGGGGIRSAVEVANVASGFSELKLMKSGGKLFYGGAQAFTNNAAAVSGGLVVGNIYYTNVAGDGILKIVI